MKKLLYAAFILMGLPAAAQPIRIAPEVGLQLSNQTIKVNGGKAVGNVKPGLRAGVSIDAPLSRHFAIQPGIFYSQRGFDAPTGSGKVRVDYVEVPVNLLAKAPIGRKGRLFLGGGPFIAFGVGGKISSGSTSVDIIFGDDANSALRRIDAGVNFCGGYEAANGVILRGFATAGIANVAAGGDSDNGIRNWGYGFSIGYLIR